MVRDNSVDGDVRDNNEMAAIRSAVLSISPQLAWVPYLLLLVDASNLTRKHQHYYLGVEQEK